MPSVGFLKPVNPSKTLANFLANNTNLTVLVWWIILKFKYYYEEAALEILERPSSTSSRLKLRSGCKYMSHIDKTTLTDCWFDDSYRLCNKFDRTLKSKLKGTIHKDKMIYDCLISL